jgi:hypothetical protein
MAGQGLLMSLITSFLQKTSGVSKARFTIPISVMHKLRLREEMSLPWCQHQLGSIFYLQVLKTMRLAGLWGQG